MVKKFFSVMAVVVAFSFCTTASAGPLYEFAGGTYLGNGEYHEQNRAITIRALDDIVVEVHEISNSVNHIMGGYGNTENLPETAITLVRDTNEGFFSYRENIMTSLGSPYYVNYSGIPYAGVVPMANEDVSSSFDMGNLLITYFFEREDGLPYVSAGNTSANFANSVIVDGMNENLLYSTYYYKGDPVWKLSLNIKPFIGIGVDDGVDNGTKVPEPASLALLGIGLLAVGFIRRRNDGINQKNLPIAA